MFPDVAKLCTAAKRVGSPRGPYPFLAVFSQQGRVAESWELAAGTCAGARDSWPVSGRVALAAVHGSPVCASLPCWFQGTSLPLAGLTEARAAVLKAWPRASRISLTGELVRDGHSQPHPRPESEALGWGPAIWVSSNLPDDSETHSSLRSTRLWWGCSCQKGQNQPQEDAGGTGHGSVARTPHPPDSFPGIFLPIPLA